MIDFNAIQNATAYVERKRGPSFTEYRITGSEAAVRCKVEALFREFPADGYGTWVKQDGDTCVVTVANSCD